MTIADRISELRRANDLSQEDLAEKTGVSRQAVSKWESEQSVPDMYNIVTLSEIFGVTTDYLLKGIEPTAQTTFVPAAKKIYPEAKVFNIVGTTLNALGLVLSAALYAFSEDEKMSLIAFVMMTLGIMTFMLGTTKLREGEQLENACKFIRANVWIVGFFVLSLALNAFLHATLAPYPADFYISHSTDDVWTINGNVCSEGFIHFALDVSLPLFIIVYTVSCAAVTYITTLACKRKQQGRPFFAKKASAAKRAEEEN